jgi:hypothetical protein
MESAYWWICDTVLNINRQYFPNFCGDPESLVDVSARSILFSLIVYSRLSTFFSYTATVTITSDRAATLNRPMRLALTKLWCLAVWVLKSCVTFVVTYYLCLYGFIRMASPHVPQRDSMIIRSLHHRSNRYATRDRLTNLFSIFRRTQQFFSDMMAVSFNW